MAVKNYIDLYGTTYDLADGVNLAGAAEETNTATVAHATGSYFLWKGEVYQATTAIAVGDTIASGTNCSKALITSEIAKTTGEIADLKNQITQLENDGTSRLDASIFVHGGLNVNTGAIVNGYNYRCSAKENIVYTRKIVLTPASGYRFYPLYMSGSTVTFAVGWQTAAFTISANQEFRILIAKVTEDTSSIANINEFVNAIEVTTFITELDSRIDELESNKSSVRVSYTNVYDQTNTDLILSGKLVNSSGDLSDNESFSTIKIPVNGIDGKAYNVYGLNSGETGYIPLTVRFAMYTESGTKIGLLVNSSDSPAVVNDNNCRYLYTSVSTANLSKIMILVDTGGATLGTWNKIPYGSHYITDTRWYNKGWATYGDSISAMNNGNFLGKGWAGYVNYEYGFTKSYGRSVGGETFKWGNKGGVTVFCKTADGQYYDRNSTPLDDYTGTVPEGCTAARGAMCSWLRIKTMFPASIKDNVNMVFIMAGSNDTYTANEELTWVAEDTTDPEWASSDEYANYGGDYNISTTIGAVASTVMKFQAWLPNAIIVLGTPLNGNVETNPPTIRPNYIPDEYYKKDYIKTVASIFGIPCIDVFSTCGINVLNAPNYLSDSVHPFTENGCKMLARTVIGGLKTIYPML